MIHPISRGAPIGRRSMRLRGFTLVETVICIVITSVMLAAALSATSAARVGMYKITERQQGDLLAHELMAEILIQCYNEPDGDTAIGIDTDEVATDRSGWDDVDDYDNWAASPPQYRDGTVIPDRTGWTRQVVVDWVKLVDLTEDKTSDKGLKRITVVVSHNNTPVATLVAIKHGSI